MYLRIVKKVYFEVVSWLEPLFLGSAVPRDTEETYALRKQVLGLEMKLSELQTQNAIEESLRVKELQSQLDAMKEVNSLPLSRKAIDFACFSGTLRLIHFSRYVVNNDLQYATQHSTASNYECLMKEDRC